MYTVNRVRQATITELIFIPDEVPNGLYLLNLQVAPMENDAAPSRPVLFHLDEEMMI
jgi:arylformamidase